MVTLQTPPCRLAGYVWQKIVWQKMDKCEFTLDKTGENIKNVNQ